MKLLLVKLLAFHRKETHYRENGGLVDVYEDILWRLYLSLYISSISLWIGDSDVADVDFYGSNTQKIIISRYSFWKKETISTGACLSILTMNSSYPIFWKARSTISYQVQYPEDLVKLTNGKVLVLMKNRGHMKMDSLCHHFREVVLKIFFV